MNFGTLLLHEYEIKYNLKIYIDNVNIFIVFMEISISYGVDYTFNWEQTIRLQKMSYYSFPIQSSIFWGSVNEFQSKQAV